MEILVRVEGISLFKGGRWFRSQSECEYFSRDQIPEGKFQWFIGILNYLQFVTRETVLTAESHMDEDQAAK